MARLGQAMANGRSQNELEAIIKFEPLYQRDKTAFVQLFESHLANLDIGATSLKAKFNALFADIKGVSGPNAKERRRVMRALSAVPRKFTLKDLTDMKLDELSKISAKEDAGGDVYAHRIEEVNNEYRRRVEEVEADRAQAMMHFANEKKCIKTMIDFPIYMQLHEPARAACKVIMSMKTTASGFDIELEGSDEICEEPYGGHWNSVDDDTESDHTPMKREREVAVASDSIRFKLN